MPNKMMMVKKRMVKMDSNQKVFHQASGIAQSSGKMSPGYKAPTPLKVIGDTLKTVAKSVAKTIDTQLIKPSRDYNKIQKAKDNANRKKAESGMYN